MRFWPVLVSLFFKVQGVKVYINIYLHMYENTGAKVLFKLLQLLRNGSASFV